MNKQQDEAIQRDMNKQPVAIKVLNAILNGLWRIVSAAGILITALFAIVAVNGQVAEEYYPWMSLVVLITAIGFMFLQINKGKDIIHIEVKIEKEKKTDE